MNTMPGIDVEIGVQPKISARKACPYCGSACLRALTPGDFPAEARSEVAKALLGGALLIECGECSKRYAVQTKPSMNRHQRRRLAAIQRRTRVS